MAALVALGLLAFGVDSVFAGDDDPIEQVVEATAPVERRIDLIDLVESFALSDDFALDADGSTVGYADLTLEGDRVMRIAPGTPGSIECTDLRLSNRCVVLADLVGDAVIWFAIRPRGPSDTVVLPPIVDLQDEYAIFDNGWQIRYPPVIRRNCADEFDVTSFSDFLRRFGPNSTSIVDLDSRQVTEVVCGEEFVPPATTIGPADLEPTTDATG